MASGKLPVKKKLGYPIAQFDRQSLHLQPNFYGVKVLNGSQNLMNGIADLEILRLSQYTDIVYVKVNFCKNFIKINFIYFLKNKNFNLNKKHF